MKPGETNRHLGFFEYRYDGGLVIRAEVPSDDTLKWTCVEGEAKGTSGIERTERREVAPGVHLICWTEMGGMHISQVVNFFTRKVVSVITTEGEHQVIEGTIRRLDKESSDR